MGLFGWVVLVALFAVVLWEMYAIRQALGAVAFARTRATSELEARVVELESQVRQMTKSAY